MKLWIIFLSFLEKNPEKMKIFLINKLRDFLKKVFMKIIHRLTLKKKYF